MTISEISSHNRLYSVYLDGSVNGKVWSFLVDTGATRTIVRPDVIEGNVNLIPVEVNLRTATGETLPTDGETTVRLGIGKKVLDHRVLVANIEDEVIMGIDLLCKFGVEMDMKRGVVKVGNEELPIESPKESLLARVILMEEIKIPGRSETIVIAEVEGSLPEGQVRLIEPVEDMKSRNGILVAKAVVRAGSSVPVRIMSVNSDSVILKKGTTIG